MKSRLRPILDTVGVTIIILVAVLLYWSMTKRGVLVPTEPIRNLVSAEDTPPPPPGKAPKTNGTIEVASQPAATSTRAPRPESSPTQQNQMTNPVNEVKETKETSDQIEATESIVNVAEKPTPTEKPAPALRRNPLGGTPEQTRTSPSSATLPEVTTQDETIARHWMTSTNNRPTIQVAYRPSEIIERLSRGDGLLIASAPDGAGGRREFRLAGHPKADADFVALSPAVASRFSNFGIALNNSGEIASITAPLGRYFGQDFFTVELVPDYKLAKSIFTEVSRALRALEHGNRQGIVIEGRLHPVGSGKVFSVSRIRWRTGELRFGLPEAVN